ncbi:hypothetical protein VTK73DRAFT_4132 [Phialemonium thermophilum]|uniref:Uncharacterized protein n=1 Tax=Phialemonium thermophilum TaxID=223376 RepID=A0ABR3VB80_9PEZI
MDTSDEKPSMALSMAARVKMGRVHSVQRRSNRERTPIDKVPRLGTSQSKVHRLRLLMRCRANQPGTTPYQTRTTAASKHEALAACRSAISLAHTHSGNTHTLSLSHMHILHILSSSLALSLPSSCSSHIRVERHRRTPSSALAILRLRLFALSSFPAAPIRVSSFMPSP